MYSVPSAVPPGPELHPRFSYSRPAVLVRGLLLVEGSFAWVVGCAWTDAVVQWTPLVMYPTPQVVLEDSGVSVALTVLAVCWLILTGPSADAMSGLSDDKKGDRGEIEKFFFTKALRSAVVNTWRAPR